jgi:hypothetical protein
MCGISGIMPACPKRRWQNGTDQSDGCPVAENAEDYIRECHKRSLDVPKSRLGTLGYNRLN